MKTLRLLALLGCVCLWAAAADPSLQPQLEPLRPLLGKTWKGELKNSTPDRPLVNVMRFERALNGQAVRIVHSLNDGAYGGESLLVWDAGRSSIIYGYVTTANFYTTGTMKCDKKTFTTHEKVAGEVGSTTEVKAVFTLKDDGSLHFKADHLKDGSWEPGVEITYRVDPNAKVIFK